MRALLLVALLAGCAAYGTRAEFKAKAYAYDRTIQAPINAVYTCLTDHTGFGPITIEGPAPHALPPNDGHGEIAFSSPSAYGGIAWWYLVEVDRRAPDLTEVHAYGYRTIERDHWRQVIDLCARQPA